jgi:aryl-alcohol dehydrogenase-like predicted oxidoreductase
LVKAVGVSNYSVSQTEKAFDQLNKYGIPLASNQVKYNLLDRGPDRSGLVKLCKELGVTIIAYSPLEIGILTGKYGLNNPSSDIHSWRYNRNYLKKIEPLLDKLKEIGMNKSGKTPGQVSLNWIICKGIVPIPGAKNAAQAAENAGVMGWYLTPEEVDQLDRLSEEVLGNTFDK